MWQTLLKFAKKVRPLIYRLFLRSVLFLFNPESVHHATVKSLQFAAKLPGFKLFCRLAYQKRDKQLERRLFGISFPNPVGMAAGFDKNGTLVGELAHFGFGFVEIGTVTPEPQEGNPKPRLFRLKSDRGIVNRMGFNNEGAEVISKRLKNRTHRLIVGGNIGKNTATPTAAAKADYLSTFKQLHPHVDYFVVNVSCPNVGDTSKLQDRDFLLELLGELQSVNANRAARKPILLKIAPDLNRRQLDEVIDIVQRARIDGVVATNTTTQREGLKADESALRQIGKGGLSGQPLKEKSTATIRYLAEQSGKSFPIIGVGGIHSPEDALEKLNAGADLVQLYTGFIYEGPALVKRINSALLSHHYAQNH